jgi:hypothetical protein
MAKGVLGMIRRVRTFDPRAFVHGHPLGIYLTTVAGIFVFANYKQVERCKKMYPDYDAFAKTQGGMYNEAKMQELHDVKRYNNMVNSMRDDLAVRRGLA